MSKEPATFPDLAEWAERQRALMQRQVDLMLADKMRICDVRGGETLDESSVWIIEYEKRIAEFDALKAVRAEQEPFAEE